MFKWIVSDSVMIMLKNYSRNNVEVGGVIFGDVEENIVSISFKRGNYLNIEFKKDDTRLYLGPPNSFQIGTWHHHHKFDNQPSAIDIRQWKSWNSDLIHIITNNVSIKIFNSKGEELYEQIY